MLKKLFRRPVFGFSNFELGLLIVVIIILGSLVAVSASTVQQKNRDTTRKNRIIALQEQADSYQAETGHYPTAAELNDPSFIAKNLPGFDTSILRDPLWQAANPACTFKNRPQLEPTTVPARGCFSYAASPGDCDNQNIDCTSYTLSVRLEAGGYFIRTSSD